jgi:putative mRNA 3-end processing factor
MNLVVWTPQGLYCPPGDFYIDPRHRVAQAVITHAHGDHARSGCDRYWTAARGAALLRERIGNGARIVPLAYGARASFNGVQVSLHSAGHILGSAQVRIEHEGQVWVVSGDYKRDDDPSCDPFEIVPCDVFVTEATFARPEFDWSAQHQVSAQILDWWQDCRRQGRTAVLACYALGKSQRVLAELQNLTIGSTEHRAYLHGSMTRFVRFYREAGIDLLPTEAIGAQVRHFNWAGQLVLAPPNIVASRWIKRFRPASLALASGWVRPGHPLPEPYDQGFTLSDHADWPSLLRTIAECGAHKVRTMHGYSELLDAYLSERGIETWPLNA